MLIDLHCHTNRHSACSIISPDDLIRRAVKRGLQGVVITEHHYLWSREAIDRLRTTAEVDGSFLILAGQEVDTGIGHVLVLGAGETIGGRIQLPDLRKRYPRAALVWAHPFRHGREPTGRELTNPLLDGVEIFSMNHTATENYRGLTSWHEHKFTAVSGSDTHRLEMAAMFPTLFDHPVRTVEEVAREIKAGRCRPLYKEIPAAGSNIVVTRITIGSKGPDESRSSIVVKTVTGEKKWRRTKRTLKLIDSLRRKGFGKGTYRVPGIIDVNDTNRVLIEERQRGKTLFDLVSSVNPDVGIDYYRLAARWLARFHVLGLKLRGVGYTARKERSRFAAYVNSFESTGNPRTDDVSRVIERIANEEELLFQTGRDRFVQVHGDYHPKNIIIGQDLSHDISTLYISVIDFDSTFCFLPAFDVGYFISQFMYQFRSQPLVGALYQRSAFLDAYREQAGTGGERFEREVRLFELRANMSIASYLVKVGKGESEDMDWLMERSLQLMEQL